jgi:hypothetical protein
VRVLRRPLAVVLALVLVGAGAAAAASFALSGTYKVTISGKPAALNGKWKLEFLPRGVVHTLRNGKLVVVGKAVRSGQRRLTFSDRSGPYACSASEGKGLYVYKPAAKRLTFAAVADKCIGRKLILTTKPFSR